MIWRLAFEKKPFQFWREIWIQVVIILLQLYRQWHLALNFGTILQYMMPIEMI